MTADFSVLMSVYYKENPEWFRASLDSIFSQTLLPSEVVLVKDGALTIDLEEVITEYRNRYPIFKILENEKNMGLGLSLQRGVLASSYEIIARMDTDDLMHPTRFEKEYKCLLENSYDVVSCWTLMFEGSLKNVVSVKKRPEFHNDIVKLARRRSPMSHPGSMFRKSAVLRAGNYQDVHFYEDYHLWVRMILTGSIFYNIQEPLFYLRTSLEQVKRRGGWKYAKNEVKVFLFFYRSQFYSLYDLIINILLHIPIRLLPAAIREFILKIIWKN